jgi:transcriptional antiterminator RfaH
MAILAAEPSLYPDTLFEANAAAAGPCRWRVLHTKPRQEKALARSLLGQEIPFFLPVRPKRTRIRGKDVPAYIPLFSGYLFLYANADGLVQALSTKRVARSLEVVDQSQLWTDLRQIHRLLQSGRTITPEQHLVPGTPVTIREGPLMGLQGIILRSASGDRFVVQVNFIQQGASVLLDGHLLERTTLDRID